MNYLYYKVDLAVSKGKSFDNTQQSQINLLAKGRSQKINNKSGLS